MAKLDTYINIDVNGQAAVVGLGKVERAAENVDDEIDAIGGQSNEKMSALASGTDAVVGKMRDLAGPAAVGAVVGGMVAAVEKTIELGIQADTIATALDITTEEASRLAAAFGDVGIEANDIVDIGLQIQGGLEDNTDLTDRLGVVMEDLKSPVDAIRVGIDNWDLLTPTERATLFGEEGVRQISRMVAEGQTLDQILAGVADIRVISEADAERARKMAASMAELKGLVEGVTLVVGGNLLEAFENVQAVADLLPGDLEAATIAAELFAAALSPPLTILAKIDDAVNKVAQTFAGELDPAAQTVADSVLRAFEETEQGAEDLSTAGTAAIREIGSEYDKLRGKLDDRNAWLTLQDTIDEVKRKGAEAFAAGVEGAENAEAANRDYEQSMNDLTLETLDYLTQVLEIPEERATQLALSYSGKTPDEIEAELERLTRQRTVRVLFQVPEIPRFVAAPTASNSVTNNVTINASRTLSGRELSQLSQDWARVNG